MKLVLANGVFDIFHIGHLRHLQEAREMGDFLIVSLTLDEYVNKGPGRPINKWEDRAAILRQLYVVGNVVPTRNACDAIRLYKPAIFVKGIDYKGGKFSEDVFAACREVGAEIRYTEAPKTSATEIITKTMSLAHAASQ